MHSVVSRLGHDLRPGCQPFALPQPTGAHARDYFVQALDRRAGIRSAGRCPGNVTGHGRKPHQDEAATRVCPQSQRAQDAQQEDRRADRQLEHLQPDGAGRRWFFMYDSYASDVPPSVIILQSIFRPIVQAENALPLCFTV